MRALYISILLLLGLGLQAPAALAQLVAANIPASLQGDETHAVVRLDETLITIESTSKFSKSNKSIVTILNKEGSFKAVKTVFYDQLSVVENFTAALYDANGKRIKRLKSKDITDVSATSSNLFDDNRKKVADLRYDRYPYTVVFEYTVVNRNPLILPDWYPVRSTNVAVEKASLQVLHPKNITIRHYLRNMDSPPTSKVQDNNLNLLWQVANIKPFVNEQYDPPATNWFPSVNLAYSSINVNGYAGAISTWNLFGQWYQQLLVGRNDLPEATKAKIKALVADADSDLEKTRRIYKYLQDKTRYVSIQLGIGGWQPFKTSLVDTKSYGDCKALSFYTQALLAEAGIKSNLALVRAGSGAPDIIKDFPSNQFNHMILAVPLVQDTVWLECTSQVNPFGYLGRFTGNRHVLLITDEGGKVVKTPAYTANKNLQNRTVQVKIKDNGDATLQASTTYTGIQYDSRSELKDYSFEDRSKYIYRVLDIPSFDVQRAEYQEIKTRIPEVKEDLVLNIRNCASTTGNRLFLQPNILNKRSGRLKKQTDRVTDFYYGFSWSDADTIIYEFPEGYMPEAMPKATKLEGAFGSYETSFSIEGNKLIYIRKMMMKEGTYPPETFNEFVEFNNKVIRADNAKVVMVKNT